MCYPTPLGSTSIAHEGQAGSSAKCLLTFAPLEQQEIEFNFSRANRLFPKLRTNRLNEALREDWQTLLCKRPIFGKPANPKASSPAELGQYVAREIEAYCKSIVENAIKSH